MLESRFANLEPGLAHGAAIAAMAGPGMALVCFAELHMKVSPARMEYLEERKIEYFLSAPFHVDFIIMLQNLVATKSVLH